MSAARIALDWAAAGLAGIGGAVIATGHVRALRAIAPWVGAGAVLAAALLVGARGAGYLLRTDRIGALVRGAVLAQIASVTGAAACVLTALLAGPLGGGMGPRAGGALVLAWAEWTAGLTVLGALPAALAGAFAGLHLHCRLRPR